MGFTHPPVICLLEAQSTGVKELWRQANQWPRTRAKFNLFKYEAQVDLFKCPVRTAQ